MMFTNEEIESLTAEDLAAIPPAFRIPLIDAQAELRRHRRSMNIGVALILAAAAAAVTETIYFAMRFL